MQMDGVLVLEGMDCCLPSLEEQAAKRSRAFANLYKYIESCGGTLPEGWKCAMRFRITTRRHGKQGLTTDNYYYSPCGRTFRTHQQVAEFLGLQPAPKKQQQGEELEAEVPENFSIVSVTITHPGCEPPTTSSRSQGNKRSHTAMTASDIVSFDCQDQLPAAVSAPAAVVCTCSTTMSGMSVTTHHFSTAQSAPAACQPVVKRTKAALAAKYAGRMRATAPPASTAASNGISCATGTPSSSCCESSQHTPFVATSGARLAAPQPTMQAQPAASSTTGSVCNSKAGSSRETAQETSPFRQHSKQALHKPAEQPVPKWKPRQQPAWRAKLRELATQVAAERGILLAKPNATKAAQRASSC